MKHRAAIALAAILLGLGVFSTLVWTQTSGDPCKDGTTPAQSECSHRRFLASDAELNQTYQKLLAGLKGNKEAIEKLRASERAWLQYRDSECEFESFFGQGGTGQGAAHSECLVGITNERRMLLQRVYDDEIGSR